MVQETPIITHARARDEAKHRVFAFQIVLAGAAMGAPPNQSNVLLCASATLSLVSVSLFVASSFYFQSVINVQKEQLVLLTDQQDELRNEVSILKRYYEQDPSVSYWTTHYYTLQYN